MNEVTTRRHGCHNRPPFKEAVKVQDGWAQQTEVVGLRVIATRLPIIKTIPNPMSTGCQYTLHGQNHADPACAGCNWRMPRAEAA